MLCRQNRKDHQEGLIPGSNFKAFGQKPIIFYLKSEINMDRLANYCFTILIICDIENEIFSC